MEHISSWATDVPYHFYLDLGNIVFFLPYYFYRTGTSCPNDPNFLNFLHTCVECIKRFSYIYIFLAVGINK